MDNYCGYTYILFTTCWIKRLIWACTVCIRGFIRPLPILAMNYLVMCRVYTYVGGINRFYHVCPPVCKITHSLKFMHYLHVQADNPWYNYNYILRLSKAMARTSFLKRLSLYLKILQFIKTHLLTSENIINSSGKFYDQSIT